MRHRRRRLARGRRSLRAAWWRGYRFALAVERWRTSLVAGIVIDELGPELTPEQEARVRELVPFDSRRPDGYWGPNLAGMLDDDSALG